jgi:hypothetical protein
MFKRHPLPLLRDVAYSGQAQFTPLPLSRTRRVVPWYILESTPGIKTLHLARGHDNPHENKKLHVLSPSEIRRIRTLCPDLCVLKLNIDLSTEASAIEAVFDELAQFKEPIELILHIRLPCNHSKRFVNYRASCRTRFMSILKQRKSLGLPCQPPFCIRFIAMRMERDSVTEWVRSTCIFRAGPSVTSYRVIKPGTGKRQELDMLSVDELKEKSKEQSLLQRIRDCNGYKRELRRRERSSGEAFGFADDFTLHNLWA